MHTETEPCTTFEGRGSQRLDERRLQNQLDTVAADFTDDCEVRSRATRLTIRKFRSLEQPTVMVVRYYWHCPCKVIISNKSVHLYSP